MVHKRKVALINGGARMGETIALSLAEKDVDIILTYRHSKESALEIQKKVLIAGMDCWVVRCDVTQEFQVKQTFQFIQKKIGRLDYVVNLASTYGKTPWKKLNHKIWTEQLNNNVTGVYLMGLYAAPLLKKFKGRMVNFADWLTASGRPLYRDFIPYYTAKSAVIGLTQAQALELAPEVLVNAIAPGPILPPAGASSAEIQKVIKATPLKKWGGVDEIAKTVLFLCETEFITGECIRVDGGRHLY